MFLRDDSKTWLIALGSFTGGRLWLDSPVGSHPPPCIKEQWQKSLRGDYHDISNKRLNFDPTLYHAVEPVTSSQRVLYCFVFPRGWKKLSPPSIEELADIGFFPPFSAQAAEVPATADLLLFLAAPPSTSVDSEEPTGPKPLTTANADEEIVVPVIM